MKNTVAGARLPQKQSLSYFQSLLVSLTTANLLLMIYKRNRFLFEFVNLPFGQCWRLINYLVSWKCNLPFIIYRHYMFSYYCISIKVSSNYYHLFISIGEKHFVLKQWYMNAGTHGQTDGHEWLLTCALNLAQTQSKLVTEEMLNSIIIDDYNYDYYDCLYFILNKMCFL